MAFAHVVTAQKEHHMVLVYIGPKGEESLILDNQYPDVMPAEARSDLIGVYMFQDKAYEEDEVRLIILKDNVIARRTLKDRKDNFMLKKWVDAKKRARQNIKSLIPFNDGRPLLPHWVRIPGLTFLSA